MCVCVCVWRRRRQENFSNITFEWNWFFASFASENRFIVCRYLSLTHTQCLMRSPFYVKDVFFFLFFQVKKIDKIKLKFLRSGLRETSLPILWNFFIVHSMSSFWSFFTLISFSSWKAHDDGVEKISSIQWSENHAHRYPTPKIVTVISFYGKCYYFYFPPSIKIYLL